VITATGGGLTATMNVSVDQAVATAMEFDEASAVNT
jgi:hypothetical protein